MLIHVSLQDLQRNLDKYSVHGGTLDVFAPGWRANVNSNQAIGPFRAALLSYWLDEIRKLGKMPAQGVELMLGSKETAPLLVDFCEWSSSRAAFLESDT
jgi:hypothetical protein